MVTMSENPGCRVFEAARRLGNREVAVTFMGLGGSIGERTSLKVLSPIYDWDTLLSGDTHCKYQNLVIFPF